MKKFILFLIFTIATPLHPASAIMGTPGGTPGVPRSIDYNLVAADQTDIEVTWAVPSTDGGGTVDDGGATITGYFATAWTATAGGVPIAATAGTCSTSSIAPATPALTCTIIGLNFGTRYVIKIYARNVNGAGTEGVGTKVITTPALSQTVDFDAGTPAAMTYDGADVTVHATATSGLTATYSSVTPTVCSVTSDSGIVHAILAGDCKIRATQDGVGSGYASASTAAAGDHPDALIVIAPHLAATINAVTYIQSTQATLNAIVPFSGKTTTPLFCVKKVDPGATPPNTCAGGEIVNTYSISSITQASEGGAITAVAKSLLEDTTYYVWIIASADGSTPIASSDSVNFKTPKGPTISGDTSVTADLGGTLTANFTATSGSGIYPTWEYGDLPAGTTFQPDVAGATIVGTPTVAGTINSWVKVTDSNNMSSNLWAITFTVTDPLLTQPNDPLPTFQCNDAINYPGDPRFDPAAAHYLLNPALIPACYSKNLDPGKSEIPPILPLIIPSNPNPVIGGDSENIKYTINSLKNELGIEADTWSLHLSTTAGVINAKVNAKDAAATQLVIEKGHSATTRGTGFAPNSRVYLYISSTTALLGVLQTDAAGSFIGTFPLPDYLELGPHHIQVNGWSKARKLRSATVGIKVVKQSGKLQKATVYFDLDRYNLTAKSVSTLKTLVNSTKKAIAADGAKKVIVQVVGFVQPTKKNPFPGKLSTSRATAVANYLKAKGIVGKYVITGAGNARKNVAASRMATVSINWG
jgi:hypothetical protein